MTHDDQSNSTRIECPSDEVLDLLATGSLEQEAAILLRGHIAICETCRDAMGEFLAAAQFGSLLKEAHNDVPERTRRKIVKSVRTVIEENRSSDQTIV